MSDTQSQEERRAVEAEILEWMHEAPWREDEARFDRLARSLFEVQLEGCAAYARFSRGRGATASSIESWREIPAVPTGAFKELALRSFAPERTRKVFRTSGTTGAARGELHLDTLELYEASLLSTLEQLLFAAALEEGSRDLVDLRDASSRPMIRVLAPSPAEMPDSSLSHMFGVLVRELGSKQSGFDFADGELQVEELLAAIDAAIAQETPLVLCGTAFAFVHLIDALAPGGRSVRCPPSTRIMETGGFKGRSREMPRDELYRGIEQRLGVPEARIVNQYGMTELGSQFYDSVLIDPDGPRRKLGPPWARVRIVDPETGHDCQAGGVGMLVIHDLANTGSVAAIQTSDLGRRIVSPSGARDGFEVLGREPGAEARGCSIALDAMLTGT